MTFQAFEDKCDGYRSMLSSIQINEINIRPVFRENVKIQAFQDDGIQLINSDGDIILQVGTSDYDDYYPTFTFIYQPTFLSENKRFQNIIKKINTITED